MDEERAESGRPSLTAWAAGLPSPAAKVVLGADLTQPYLYLPMPATPSLLRPLRARITAWAERIEVPEGQRDDMILAVNEAATNSIEHAYHGNAGVLTVFAGSHPDTDTVYVVVSDDGEWRVPPVDPGFRGRGLPIIKELAPTFDLHHDRNGTTIVLGW